MPTSSNISIFYLNLYNAYKSSASLICSSASEKLMACSAVETEKPKLKDRKTKLAFRIKNYRTLQAVDSLTESFSSK